MTKVSAVKRAAAPAAGAWRPQAARVDALIPDNIEQAADLGAGYVIIKLRDVRRKGGAARAAELPIMSRERLVAALNRGGALTKEKPRVRPAENDAFMRKMVMQEKARRVEQEETGQLIAAQELARRLEVSNQAVSKALKAGRLFALDASGGRLLYPAFYADGKMSRRDLEAVTRALGDIPASSKWQFFTNPRASLNGLTPLEALQRGQRQAVMVSAAGFVER
ncbi:hypothetical protein ACLB1G_15950 [Oxalobacteraceae bacterium A2-2]